MSFKSISEAQHQSFLSALKAGQYNLLLGAGASMDSSNAFGEIPSGDALRDNLAEFKKVSKKYTLQKVFSLLSDSEIREHITKRFSGCKPGLTPQTLSKFLWKRIFTWNIDDVLENAYSRHSSGQRLIPIHYSDDYVESQNLSELPLIHLHGSVKDAEKGYVFSRDQYVNQIVKINPWMTVLSQFMQSEPMIIAGTSLDEIDLDYYLAQRSNVTSRDDRGPSILVTSEDDSVSEDICLKHNLIHFVGWSSHFFQYCSEILPSPPTPEQLIPAETRRLLPPSLGKAKALSFFSDFELVPASAAKPAGSRFLYGHSPTWSDLGANLDIPRAVTADLILDVERRLADPSESRLILLADAAGVGKTTIIRRVAFELAGRGIRTLLCSALSRIDSSTSNILDQIQEPIVIIIDDFADQVTAMAEVLSNVKKKNIVVLASERGHRINYLNQVLGGIPISHIYLPSLNKLEVEKLVDTYVDKGLVGDQIAIKNRDAFSNKVSGDPIAIACCRIMNDFRPLERIVNDAFDEASLYDVDRYLCAALAEHCFKGGLRYEILLKAVNPEGIRAQFDRQNPLPLGYFDSGNEFVIPENATLGDRLLVKVSSEEKELLLRVFVALALELRPRVNRKAIKRRTPEARLAGRLFDYDDIVEKFLGKFAERFYADTKEAWQWNSRYWEQVALLKLANFHKSPNSKEGLVALETAVQHARFAVSIEHHPFGLTTLGKILMTQMKVNPQMRESVYEEAFNNLTEAISLENAKARSSVQPYASLFAGTVYFLECGGVLSGKQRDKLSRLLPVAYRRFSKEPSFEKSAMDLTLRLAGS